MHKAIFSFAVLILLGLASCSPGLTPFTQKLNRQNNWSENELKQIQFYLSSDIAIHRELSKNSSEITNGEIKIVKGRRIEEVIIPKGTPGLLTFVDGKEHFAVSFEAGENYLVFGPNPQYGSRYVLLAKEWENRAGKVVYGGKEYYTTPESAKAFLLVDLKKIHNHSVDRRTVPGRTLE